LQRHQNLRIAQYRETWRMQYVLGIFWDKKRRKKILARVVH
jgi:hypothetical protein